MTLQNDSNDEKKGLEIDSDKNSSAESLISSSFIAGLNNSENSSPLPGILPSENPSSVKNSIDRLQEAAETNSKKKNLQTSPDHIKTINDLIREINVLRSALNICKNSHADKIVAFENLEAKQQNLLNHLETQKAVLESANFETENLKIAYERQAEHINLLLDENSTLRHKNKLLTDKKDSLETAVKNLLFKNSIIAGSPSLINPSEELSASEISYRFSLSLPFCFPDRPPLERTFKTAIARTYRYQLKPVVTIAPKVFYMPAAVAAPKTEALRISFEQEEKFPAKAILQYMIEKMRNKIRINPLAYSLSKNKVETCCENIQQRDSLDYLTLPDRLSFKRKKDVSFFISHVKEDAVYKIDVFSLELYLKYLLSCIEFMSNSKTEARSLAKHSFKKTSFAMPILKLAKEVFLNNCPEKLAFRTQYTLKSASLSFERENFEFTFEKDTGDRKLSRVLETFGKAITNMTNNLRVIK